MSMLGNEPITESNMLPENRIPTHPGEILLEEFLKPMGISQVDFARHIGVPLLRVNEIVRGKRGVTPDTAWQFAQALCTTPEFWMSPQTNHDLARSRPVQPVTRLCESG